MQEVGYPERLNSDTEPDPQSFVSRVGGEAPRREGQVSHLQPAGHIPALDGVRGTAILAVMVYHYFLFGRMSPQNKIDRAFFFIARAGWVGVDLFFVLSGFLITGILYDTRRRVNYFSAFYARRCLRIFPLYYGALALYFFVLPIFYPLHDPLGTGPGNQIWLWAYMSNLNLALTHWEGVPMALRHFWSLAVEEHFYLVWPFVIFYLPRRGVMWVCGAAVAAALALRIWLHARGLGTAAYLLTPARVDSLTVGAALALAMRDPAGLRTVTRWAGSVLAVAVTALTGVAVWHEGLRQLDSVTGTVGITLLALAFGSLLALAVTGPGTARLTRFFAAAPLRFFGKYSYALYISHQPIAVLLSTRVVSALLIPSVRGLYLPGQLAFVAIAFGLSLGAALLSWHLYEKHFLKFKDRFPYRPAQKADQL